MTELREHLDANPSKYPNYGDFARRIGCSASRLSQLLAGAGAPASPELAIRIHVETNGAVPGNVLRPDLWKCPEHVPLPEKDEERHT